MFKAWFALALCGVAFGDTIVIPNAETSLPGNFPIGGPVVATPGIAQTLFASGQFIGPIDITKISLRTTPNTGATDFAFNNLNLYLSTSSKSVNSLSATFADNVGSDVALVFSAAGVTTLGDAGCTTPHGTCAFDITINLNTPFYYNPALGNLLLELRSSEVQAVDANGSFDGETFSSPGGAMGGVFEFGSASAATGTLLAGGDITQFTYSPVPEPTSRIMTALSLVALMWTVSRRRFGKRI